MIEIGFPQIGSVEIGPGEVDFSQVGFAHVDAVQFDRGVGMLGSPPVPDRGPRLP